MFTMLGKLDNAYNRVWDGYDAVSSKAANTIIDRLPIGKTLIRDRLGTIDKAADQFESSLLNRLNRNVDTSDQVQNLRVGQDVPDPWSETASEILQNKNKQKAHRVRQGVQFAGNTLTNPVFAVGGTGAAIIALGHMQEQRALKANTQAMAQQAGLPPEEAEVLANTAVQQMPIVM